MSHARPNPELICWHDPAEYERQAFAQAGLAGFEAFWDLERQRLDGAEVAPVRQHRHRRSGAVLRQTVSLRLNRSEYFLKRAGGPAYRWIVNEHRLVGKVAEFGLVPPRLIAWGFDEAGWRGLLLFKRLSGFDSLQDLLDFRAPPEVVAEFQTRKRDFLKRLTQIVRRVQHADYFYPDWHDKHIFVRRGGSDIALIDLERFRHRSDCPWYYRLFLVRHCVRRREWDALRRSLRSDLYTPRYLINLLEEV